MFKSIKTIWFDFFALIYPEVCAACGKSLQENEKCICLYCRYHLPETNFHKELNNPVYKIFWGRANIHAAASYYYFFKKGKVQNLIHQLKYKGHKEIGLAIGKMYGNKLKASTLFKDVDVIIPVPLHPKKQKRRGYNQSESFARGIALAYRGKSQVSMVSTGVLYRDINAETQTRKGRFQRWQNVEKTFKIHPHDTFGPLRGSHILLVDDVLTTGSTLDACANALLKILDTKVSIATIAYTQ